MLKTSLLHVLILERLGHEFPFTHSEKPLQVLNLAWLKTKRKFNECMSSEV